MSKQFEIYEKAVENLLAILAANRDVILDIDNIVIDDTCLESSIDRCIYGAIKNISESSKFDDGNKDINETILEEKVANLFPAIYESLGEKIGERISAIKSLVANHKEIKEYLRIISACAYKAKSKDLLSDLYKKIITLDNAPDVISTLENTVFEFTNKVITNTTVSLLGDYVDEFISEKLENLKNNVIDTGIKTGFSFYDKAIGDGLKEGTINVVGARSKMGKSFLGANIAINVSRQGIPVLYLDTELTRKRQMSRFLSIMSAVPMKPIERGTIFAQDTEARRNVLLVKDEFKKLPLSYIEIHGWNINQQVSCIRRWLSRTVGKDDKGKYKKCLIILDYLKLMDPSEKGFDMKEWEVLGYRMTALHDLMGQYGASMFMLVQQNRDGVDKEDSTTVSGSDRIIWLCDSFSILMNKTYSEIAAEKAQQEAKGTKDNIGNMRIKVSESRDGPGTQNKYISVYADIKNTRLREDETNAKFTEIGLEVPLIQ